jgi:hypothetical protein
MDPHPGRNDSPLRKFDRTIPQYASVPGIGRPERHGAILLPAKFHGLDARLAAPPPEQQE